jgi:hypothetical protein
MVKPRDSVWQRSSRHAVAQPWILRSSPHSKATNKRYLTPPLKTWPLVLALIVVMVLTTIALGACWGSLNTDQTIGPHQDRLTAGFVCWFFGTGLARTGFV